MTTRRLIQTVAKIAGIVSLGFSLVSGLLFLFGWLAPPASAARLATPVSCNITSATTLGLAGSPYTVNCMVDVQAVLTIQPGVVVSFSSGSQLIIQDTGRLVANGSAAQPITFTSNPGTCVWQGVELQSDTNQISHALFRYARHALKVEVGSDFNTIELNQFENNGGCASNPLSGAIVGSTDNSSINNNTFINNNTAIYLSKSTGNMIAHNAVSTTTQVALSLFPSAGTRSSNNTILSNTIYNAGSYGIHLTVGDNNSLLENRVYGGRSDGIRLESQNATAGQRLTVRNNDVYSNTGPGLYITDTATLELGENLILGNSGGGVLWNPTNDPSSAVITRNVICRNPPYLFRNDDAATVTAARNWWGTNSPSLGPGLNIQGPVNIDPRIVLTATTPVTTMPADGVSTATVTVTLADAGVTVPPRARTITLTTASGSVSPQILTLNANGQGTTTYTAGTTPGPVVITVTDICASNPLPLNLVLTPTFNLAITKTAPASWVVPGQTVTYTIQYSNTSDQPASGVVISDILPAFTTFAGDDSGLSRSGSGSGPISWTVGALAPHTGDTFVLTTTLSSGATCNGFITNTIYISGAGDEPNTTDNADTVTLQVLCGVNLITVKNDGVGTGDPRPNVRAGDYITYTISVNNMGNQLATNVVLSDTLPAYTIFDAARSSPGWTAAGGGVYTIGLSNLAGNGGGAVVRFVVQVDPNLPCAITETVNTAFTDSAGPEIYFPDNTSHEQTPLACNPLSLSKDDGVICAIPNQLIDYSITVANNAGTPANNLVLTEFLPDYTSFQGPINTWTFGGGNIYTRSIGSLTGVTNTLFSVLISPTIPATVTAITNQVTLAPGGLSFVLTTPITHNAPDLYVIKNDNIELLSAATAEIIARLEQKLGPLPWLEAVKDPALGAQAISVSPGDTISYTLAFGNAGNSSVADVVITETLPANTSFVGPLYWVPINANTYVYTISTLSPGSGGNLDFRVRVDQPFPAGTIGVTNTVQIAGLGAAECDLSNNISREFTRVDRASTKIYLPIIVKQAPAGTVTPPSATLQWLDQANDRVREVDGSDPTVFSPDGRSDGAFRLTLNVGSPSPRTVAHVRLTSSQGANVEWDTIINARPVLGIFNGSTRLNNADGTVNQAIGGQIIVTLYASDDAGSSRFPPDTYDYTVIITFTDGASAIATARIPRPPINLLAHVSDVAADPASNQVFVASPRHDWVYVIDGSSDTLARNVPVGHGPTGLTVLTASVAANHKVFVAHQYGVNFYHPGVKAFGVHETTSHDTFDTGYAGTAPIKIEANSTHNSRVYVSNYFDKLAVLDGDSSPPENRLGWVQQKAYQAAYGLDTSAATNRVYLASRDTGELVVFDGNGDRLLQAGYIPTHVKPPQPCSLWSVAVNETTGHVFVPCPQSGKVYVLQENQISVLDLEKLGVLEERGDRLALVVSAAAAPWISEISIPNGTRLGEEGITMDPTTGRVFITNASNNSLVVLQDGATPAYVATVTVGATPQGVDVNPATQKVYVGNTGSNNVTVVSATSPFGVIKTIPLTP